MLPPPGIEADPDVTSVAVATIAHMTIATVASAMGQASPTAVASTTTFDDSQGECSLLGPFALLVQGALGALAILSLVFKRWRERPQRPLKIWFFDVSKQVFGSVLVHVANVFMSMLTSGRFSMKLEPTTTGMRMARDMLMARDDYTPNPCSFYLLNLGIDTTLGIPILIFLLRITTALVSFTPLGKPAESIQSGNYGDPPKSWWWLKQSVIYFIGLFSMKFCVLIIFLLMPWISKVGDWALRWTEGNERLQIAFVMMIFPLIMNVMQYYIIDSFIMKKDSGHERLVSEDPDEDLRYDDDDVLSTNAISPGDSGDDVERLKSPIVVKDAEAEYDPDVDGDVPPVVGSSSSQTHPSKVVQPELFPKE